MFGYLSLIYFQLFLGVFQIESASWKGRQNKELFHTALSYVIGWWPVGGLLS